MRFTRVSLLCSFFFQKAELVTQDPTSTQYSKKKLFFKGSLLNQGSYHDLIRKSDDMRLFLRAKTIERNRSLRYDDDSDDDQIKKTKNKLLKDEKDKSSGDRQVKNNHSHRVFIGVQNK